MSGPRFGRAYATDIDEKYQEAEQQTFRGFLERLNELDSRQERFERLVWTESPKSIRVPLVIETVMDHPETLWGQACYPVVKP